MRLIVATIILQFLTPTLSTDITEDVATDKTKRTVANQVHSFAGSRPVVLYADNPASFSDFYSPATGTEVPKQVHYEFQQTPTNVNQYYQARENKYPYPSDGSVATPVQHSSVIRHGQNLAQFQPSPGPQTHQYVPGRFLYVNGKVVYQPHHLYQKPQNYVAYQSLPQQPVRPMVYQRFQPPQVHQYQKITKPMAAPEVTEEQDDEEGAEEEEENAPVKEPEDKEESDDNASYEETDDDDDNEEHYFAKYSSFHDDDDHGRYMDEDEEDSDRGSSKSVPKKYHSKTTSKPHNYSKNYSTSSKYEKPGNKAKNSGNSPSKMHYTVRYSKQSKEKPRSEGYEGKQSRNVPVMHKEKIFKEKWYVTKSSDDSMK